jgi:NAD(P)-dependent dehydrogenase (short-subunit alcohol dehydrogenase family)
MEVPFKLTKDGFETQMAVNYIGHFLLSHLLMPQLIAGSKESNRASRIVSVASCSQFAGRIEYDDFNSTKQYQGQMAYFNSKLAQVMFTRHLQKMCIEKSWDVQANSCDPGIVNTGLFATNVFGSFHSFRKFAMKVLLCIFNYYRTDTNIYFVDPRARSTICNLCSNRTGDRVKWWCLHLELSTV